MLRNKKQSQLAWLCSATLEDSYFKECSASSTREEMQWKADAPLEQGREVVNHQVVFFFLSRHILG